MVRPERSPKELVNRAVRNNVCQKSSAREFAKIVRETFPLRCSIPEEFHLRDLPVTIPRYLVDIRALPIGNIPVGILRYCVKRVTYTGFPSHFQREVSKVVYQEPPNTFLLSYKSNVDIPENTIGLRMLVLLWMILDLPICPKSVDAILGGGSSVLRRSK